VRTVASALTCARASFPFSRLREKVPEADEGKQCERLVPASLTRARQSGLSRKRDRRKDTSPFARFAIEFACNSIDTALLAA
jgi:hypothetical protein